MSHSDLNKAFSGLKALIAPITLFALIGCNHSQVQIKQANPSMVREPTADQPVVTAEPTHTSNSRPKTNSNLLSKDVDIYSFPSDLSMQKIYQVVQGRYIIKNNCLFFEQHRYDTTRLLTPLFEDIGQVNVFPDNGMIELNGTTVKLGEIISTSGNVKDEYKFYSLFSKRYSSLVENKEDNPCLLDKAIVMSGTVR